MKIRHLFVAALLLGTGQAMAQQPLYKQANAPIEERIKDLMERMTFGKEYSLEIESHPGIGTVVHYRLPIITTLEEETNETRVDR